MFEFWSEPLAPEQRDALIAKAANEIRRRRLEAPAIMALETHKPLSFVLSHLMLAGAPFMVPFLGFDTVNGYSRLFSERENVERLIREIEKPPEATCST